MELKFNATGTIMPAERITRVHLRRHDASPRRAFFVSDKVLELVGGGDAAIQADFPDAVASALLDAYISGTSVSASLAGGKSAAEFKRLRGLDEVWAVCFRRVRRNQWRILGRFSRKDSFIGLTIHHRDELQGAFTAKGQELIDRWNCSFGNAEPFRGTRLTDYLSNARDLDASF